MVSDYALKAFEFYRQNSIIPGELGDFRVQEPVRTCLPVKYQLLDREATASRGKNIVFLEQDLLKSAF